MELVLDAASVAASVRWAVTNVSRNRVLPMRLAAAAIIVHAARVMIFVLGRLRPFKDFDVRPEHRADHDQTWNWGQVYFAAVMSALGVVGVAVVRKRIRST